MLFIQNSPSKNSSVYEINTQNIQRHQFRVEMSFRRKFTSNVSNSSATVAVGHPNNAAPKKIAIGSVQLVWFRFWKHWEFWQNYFYFGKKNLKIFYLQKYLPIVYNVDLFVKCQCQTSFPSPSKFFAIHTNWACSPGNSVPRGDSITKLLLKNSLTSALNFVTSNKDTIIAGNNMFQFCVIIVREGNAKVQMTLTSCKSYARR